MEVTIEEAYAKACQIIGEQIVKERLLGEAKQSQPPSEDKAV